MDNSNKNEALEVRYDALKDETSEIIDYAIFNADFDSKEFNSEGDVILEIGGGRTYKGQEFIGEANMVLYITEHSDEPSKPTNKIVILIDGKRLEVETTDDQLVEDDECQFTPLSIVGMGNELEWCSNIRTMGVSFRVEDIKRIADAKDVKVYIDSETLYDANGGSINFRNDDGCFQIEGLQGFMKRVYHYFVDETCYVDYCASYLEKKQKVLVEVEKWVESENKRMEQKRKKIEQEEIEEEERWYRARRRNIIIIIASIIITFLCGFFWDLDWIGAIAGVIIFVCGFRLYSIGAIGGGGDGNEE